MERTKKSDCKACHITQNVSDEQVKILLGRLIDSGKLKFIDEPTYQHRLMACLACEYLEQQKTCRQCGCLIHIRIAGIHSTCPYPKHAKW
ncbi:MAG: DUF6171 family protein [Turicibacter sp.]